jgi:CRISPR-associated protein Csd2
VCRRIDALFMFSVENCNPNGDPDNDNRPRQDPETGHGLVSNVCIKRHFRDTLPHVVNGNPGYGIYISSKAILDHKLQDVHKELGLVSKPMKPPKKKKGEAAEAPAPASADSAPEEAPAKEDPEVAKKVSSRMCELHYDVRGFGAVMSSKVANAGQVRGPLQISYARTVDPIVTMEDSITRIAIQTDREAEANFMNQTFGQKHRVPYGLYVGHVFFAPSFAQKTGFSNEDLRIFWEVMGRLFEYTRSSGRDDIMMEQIVAFEHESFVGNAHAHRLFDTVTGVGPDGKRLLRRRDEAKPPRSYQDYLMPQQPEVEERVKALAGNSVKVHYLL